MSAAVREGRLGAVVAMPRLSDSMEEGTVVAWHVEDGATVAAGQELAEIETDKATMPYEVEQSGKLEIVVAAGGTARVGEPIAYLRSDDGAAGAPGAAPSPARRIDASPAARRIDASPLARRMAREHGIELAGLTGSGPRGRIVKRDVLAAAEAATGPTGSRSAPAPAPAAEAPPAAVAAAPRPSATSGRRVELSRLQQVIARRMAESKATAPDFVVEVEVDMSALVALRRDVKAQLGERPAPSINDFVVKACGLALREHPRVNGAYRGDHFQLLEHVNVGVAVAADDALLVPTVRDADVRTVGAIAAEVRRLAAAARERTLTAADMSGATFTVSNLGMLGVDRFTAVLDPPQAAILAVGATAERPWVRDGELTVARTARLALTCDHRILYGADGAAFLATVRAHLEAPALLVIG